MSVECVAIFWVLNASSGEKSCLQFSIPTGSGAGGGGREVFHIVFSRFRENIARKLDQTILSLSLSHL